MEKTADDSIRMVIMQNAPELASEEIEGWVNTVNASLNALFELGMDVGQIYFTMKIIMDTVEVVNKEEERRRGDGAAD